MQFLDLLDQELTEAELTTLSRRFSLVFEAFPGVTRRDRTREFVGYLQRHGRLAGLAEATVALRPDLAQPVARLFEQNDPQLVWLDEMSGGGGSMESALTWRWPTDGALEKDAAINLTAEALPSPAPVQNQPTLVNPYTPGRRVSDEAMFFGREKELESVQSRVQAGEHVAIVGARLVGGSSLLQFAAGLASADARRLAAYVDMNDAAHQTLPGLLDGIWSQWWARVKPGNLAPVRSLAEFVTATRKLKTAGFQPLLFLDELEQMTWRPAAFDDNLFDAWQELGREGMGFVVTAHASPADLLAQGGYQSRFYELFGQLAVGLLDDAPARALLATPVERAGIAVPNGLVDQLMEEVGPHPFFLQLAGLYLYEGLARRSNAPAQIIAHFRAAAAPYWQEMWDGLSPLAQSHFPLALTRATGGVADRQMRVLANKALVITDNTGFRPFSAGFADWVRRRQTATEVAASVMQLL